MRSHSCKALRAFRWAHWEPRPFDRGRPVAAANERSASESGSPAKTSNPFHWSLHARENAQNAFSILPQQVRANMQDERRARRQNAMFRQSRASFARRQHPIRIIQAQRDHFQPRFSIPARHQSSSVLQRRARNTTDNRSFSPTRTTIQRCSSFPVKLAGQSVCSPSAPRTASKSWQVATTGIR